MTITLVATIAVDAALSARSRYGTTVNEGGFDNHVLLRELQPLVDWAVANRYVPVEDFALNFYGTRSVDAHVDTLMRASTTQLCWAVRGKAELYDTHSSHRWSRGQVISFDSRISHGVRANGLWSCFVLDVLDRDYHRRRSQTIQP